MSIPEPTKADREIDLATMYKFVSSPLARDWDGMDPEFGAALIRRVAAAESRALAAERERDEWEQCHARLSGQLEHAHVHNGQISAELAAAEADAGRLRTIVWDALMPVGELARLTKSQSDREFLDDLLDRARAALAAHAGG